MKTVLAWFREWFSDEWSFRTEAGVKIVVSGRGGCASVDLQDEQTREVLRAKLDEFAQYDVEDGRLVKRYVGRGES